MAEGSGAASPRRRTGLGAGDSGKPRAPRASPHPRAELFAGFDVSTQSCKLVVIDLAAGAVAHVDAVRYDDDLPHYGTRLGVIEGLGEGVSESDPRMWIEAVEMLLDRLRAADVDATRIACISVSGQQHGLVALDAGGNLARPRAKLWNDFSTAEECALLTGKVGGDQRMLAEVGNTQKPGYTAAKIFHMLRHEPEAYGRATTLFLVHNFVNWHLTGGKDGGVAIMEPGDTSGTALWSPVTGDWSPVVLEAIDPGLIDKLPPVAPADRPIGSISAALAERYGLSPDCAVDAGSGDNMYGAVGTGNLVPGVVTVSLGTSGTACTVLEEPWIDPTGEIAAYCDSTGRWLPLLCVSNMANGYEAVLEAYELSHEAFDAVLEHTPPGNEGRLLVPWYGGERTPDVPLAAPLSIGFGIGDFTREHLCRAVLEGHVLNLRRGFDRMPVAPRVIHLTGGLARSPSWCRTIADVFAAETVPVEGEGAALGAAIHAAWAWHKERDPEASLAEIAAPFVKFDEQRRTRPDPRNVEIYRAQLRLFRALTDRVRGLDSGDDPFELRAALRRGL